MKTLATWLIWIGSLGFAAFALFAYLARPAGSMVHPEMMRVYAQHPVPIITHVLCSALTLLLGPTQFVQSVRTRAPRLHRIAGRIYLGVGVLFGGAAGLFMAFLAFGGLVSTVGFALLASLWLATGFAAFRTARARRFAEHRRWMIRNFALTFAAVTFRAHLGVCFAAGWEFEVFYPMVAWTSWVPNLLVAEMVVKGGRRRPALQPD